MQLEDEQFEFEVVPQKQLGFVSGIGKFFFKTKSDTLKL